MSEKAQMIGQPDLVLDGQAEPLPDHLIGLPGDRWALWRCVGLRGAGFPAEQVLALAAPPCAASADDLIAAEEQLAQARSAAFDALHHELDRADEHARPALRKALQRLKKDRPPDRIQAGEAVQSAFESLRAAYQRLEQARAEHQRMFGAAIDQIAQAIHNAAGSSRFREAVIWQNRHALHTAVYPVLRNPPGSVSRGSQRRQHEELIANYLQRYCVKNDTIGFFGPVGWARFVSEGAALTARPGPHLLAARTVAFEGWCVDMLAETLARNKALRPWIAPRRLPSVYLDGLTLLLPARRRIQLSPQQAAVLRACDGRRTAREIAAALTEAMPPLGEAEVYQLLEGLSGQGLIAWTLEIPIEVNPEQILRRQLERVEDERLRALNLRALSVLDTARNAISRAAGDAEKLDQALGLLETTFTRLTGVPATRAAGKTYAGRTLVYEDCRRDIDVAIGPAVLDALGPPLSLLLTSARWLTFEAALIYRDLCQRIYADLSAQFGSPVVALADFWRRIQPIMYSDQPPPIDEFIPVLQDRWAQALDLPPGQRHVTYRADDLRPRVLAAFDAPRPGWKFARYQSPDVLIAAASPDAIRRDDYMLVMGELHVGTNTLRAGFFLDQHPNPEEIHLALARDLPEPRVAPILPKQWPELTTRTRPGFVLPKDHLLPFSYDAVYEPEARVLPIGALVVEQINGELLVRTRDGSLSFDAIECIAEIISNHVTSSFHIFRPAPHTPRVTIDRLVIGRETWRIPVGEIAFAAAKDESDRFVAARRWARSHGIPRFAFVKTPIERKPFYVDFASPIMVNILAKMIRRTRDNDRPEAMITITEMLPGPDQSWLPDAEGRRYTSELRITAVDYANGY